MRYVSSCATNRWVFNADLKSLMLSIESRRESGSSRPSELQRRTTDDRVCCDCFVARPDNAALTSGNIRRTDAAVHQVLGSMILDWRAGGTDKLWLRPYTGYIDVCPANVAGSKAHVTRAGFWCHKLALITNASSRCTNRAVFYSVPAAGAGFILAPESTLHVLVFWRQLTCASLCRQKPARVTWA